MKKDAFAFVPIRLNKEESAFERNLKDAFALRIAFYILFYDLSIQNRTVFLDFTKPF